MSDAPGEVERSEAPFPSRRLDHVYAVLMGEPFCLRPWEIARLTDRQIQDLYFARRDESGSIVPVHHVADVDDDLAMLSMADALGISPARVEEIRAKAAARKGK